MGAHGHLPGWVCLPSALTAVCSAVSLSSDGSALAGSKDRSRYWIAPAKNGGAPDYGQAAPGVPNEGTAGVSGCRLASPADRDLQPLRVAVRDEGRLPGVVVVREAVGQVVDGMVVPEPGVVVRRRRLVVQAGRRPLGLRQLRDVPVERRAVARIGGQYAGAAEDVRRRGVDAERRLRVA